MKVEYPQRFKDLLDKYQCKYPYDDFIGCGNPNAKILIIGKENGIDFKDNVSPYRPLEKLRIEIKENFCRWIDNMENHKTRDDVESWFNVANFSQKYNPIAPYNGEEFRGPKSKKTHTNATYFAYQKFINHLLPTVLKAKEGERLNFYDYCFFTELSCNCKPMSGNSYDPETAKSIKNRLFDENGILRQPFFQEFPIIILAVHHYHEYFKREKINIIDVMGTKDFRYTYKGIITQSKDTAGQLPVYKTNGELGSKFINYHVCEDINHPHLLLHTNHFCMTTNAFIKAVADECNDFIRQYGISIY